MIKLDVWKFLQGRQRMLTRDLLRYKTLLSNATLEVLNRNLGVPQQPPPLLQRRTATGTPVLRPSALDTSGSNGTEGRCYSTAQP